MTDDELKRLAEAWLEYWRPGASSAERELAAWVGFAELELRCQLPEELWKLILEIHRREHSDKIQEVLSAGPVEDLLALYGEQFMTGWKWKRRQIRSSHVCLVACGRIG